MSVLNEEEIDKELSRLTDTALIHALRGQENELLNTPSELLLMSNTIDDLRRQVRELKGLLQIEREARRRNTSPF